MRKETEEIIKLTAKEIFLSMFDIPIAALSVFDARNYYKKSIREYLGERSIDRSNFWQKINYLKRQGLINSYLEGNERYFELTEKGFNDISRTKFSQLSIERPKGWDGRFRIVIFDIPENKKYLRDALRNKIDEVGFKQIQKSVFAYPFECKKEIDTICYYFGVRRYLKYMIAEIIEGEDEIIDFFLDKNIMNLQDLDVKK